MKLVIFAGGSGRRLWPISRQKSPKQFEPILGDRSTLQLGVDRVLAAYGAENIFISTNEKYVDLVREQLPELPPENIIGEPARRDLAAAVGLALMHLGRSAQSADEPVAILWGDNYMDQVATFRQVLAAAETLLREQKAKILFMGETPRFANENLGWIGLGEKLGEVGERPYYQFASLSYRPPLEACRRMFAEKTHVWNTGYFVTTIGFVQQQYQQQQPKIWQQLSEIGQTIGLPNYLETLHRVYPQIESISFDDAILQYIAPTDAAVIHGSMGWSDPGTLYALKEAINPNQADNVTHGLVLTEKVSDCLIYNYEPEKLVAVVGVEGMIVVNMGDALLVVHKDQIPLVKQMVNDLEGTNLEKYS
ncbi:MAG: mannose-1-phosphate guanylyltransferase [Chloroflexi bacterium]|nr:mannose-1-phosphate guanylyltransferase [Chloroflexota bacterium]MBK7920068.1 mannose-1-phosphate guanylyltransferase [Chloroflexota bacterium]